MNINEDTSEFCSPSWALVCFGEHRMMWFGPITSTFLHWGITINSINKAVNISTTNNCTDCVMVNNHWWSYPNVGFCCYNSTTVQIYHLWRPVRQRRIPAIVKLCMTGIQKVQRLKVLELHVDWKFFTICVSVKVHSLLTLLGLLQR